MPPIDRQRWPRVRALFEASVDLAKEERLEFLQGECAGDEGLLREVLKLCEADSEPGLEPPLGRLFEEAPGTVLGPYRLESVTGSGGMGKVWLGARNDGAFEKKVAIKICKRGMDTDAVLRRFGIERQVMADLDHAGIARLVDGGVTAGGLPYLVMEHVDGTPIDRFCDDRRMTIRDRLDLFLKVCDAVRYAHARGVVHRDIKPGNVLVTKEGGPKLLDFGIAKILRGGAESAATAVTIQGLVPMTPQYASPEQRAGNPVTRASDVYALGLLLFELLTGWRSPAPSGAPGSVPPRPSSAIGKAMAGRRGRPARPGSGETPDIEKIAARRGLSARHLRGMLEGDLDAIVVRALRPNPDERYADAGELGDDLERYLRGFPVRARLESLPRRLYKFGRRHRVEVAIGAGVLLVLAAATAVSSSLYVRAEANRRAAERSNYLAHVGSALSALEAGDVVRARREIDRAGGDGSSWEERHVRIRLDRSEDRRLDLGEELTGLCVSPSGSRALVGTQGGRVILVDLASVEVLHEWPGRGTVVTKIGWSGDESRAAFVREDFSFAGVDTARRVLRFEWKENRRAPRAIAVDRTFTQAACGYRDGAVELRSIPSGSVLASWRAGDSDVTDLAFDESGSLVASGTRDGRAMVYDTAARAPAWPSFACGSIWDMDFAPDGSRLAIGLLNGRVLLAERGSPAPAVLADGSGWRTASLQFSRDGTELLVSSYDRSIRVLPMREGESPRRLLGHAQQVEAAAYGPDGRIVSVSRDGTLRLWPSGADDVADIRCRKGWYMGLAVLAGAVATSGGWPGIGEASVDSYDPELRQQIWSRTLEGSGVTSLASSRDGSRLACGTEDGAVLQIDPASGEVLRSRKPHSAAVLGLAWSPDRETLASASRDGTAVLFDARGEPLRVLRGHEGAVSSVAFSPDGTRLATSGWDGDVLVFDLLREAEPIRIAAHDAEIWQVAFDPRGDMLATTSWDGTVGVFRAKAKARIRKLTGFSGRVYCLAFSPDGRRLAAAGEERVVRMFDTTSWNEVAALRGQMDRIDKIAFLGQDLLSLSIDGSLRVWDVGRPDRGPLPDQGASSRRR
ncbi:MAG: hypothetical protein Fur0037_04530 [Planctomycetota bacterium]